jgi:hypothetical protein
MAKPGMTVTVEDVGGSFAAFKKNAPKEFKSAMSDPVSKTTFAVWQRMRAVAPVGPEAPHMRDALQAKLPKRDALSGFVGIFDNDEEAHVALFNEYRPNEQPFMRMSLYEEDALFKARATKALQQAERDLSVSSLV